MADPQPLRVALAGNPNVGKTTLFNRLTGHHQRVANFPGVTVERVSGRLTCAPHIDIIDLPGTYSLTPRSVDERIAYDILTGHLERKPDLVVCVVDAGNLERNLYLVSQIIDLGLPVVVALNMVDAAARNGLEVDAVKLSDALGVPVVPIVATLGQGVEVLEVQMQQVPPLPDARQWELMDAVSKRVPELSAALAHEAPNLPEPQVFMEVLHALAEDMVLESWRTVAPAFAAKVQSARESFTKRNVAFRHAEVAGRYAWLGDIVRQVTTRNTGPSTISDRIDAVVTHRVAGPVLFLLLLLLIFQAIFSWATPAMDLVEAGVGWLSSAAQSVLPGHMLTDLLTDGVIAGVGNVVIFLPQILLLFFFLGLMEDTGYMARSAFIMDRIMKRVGLSGGSVLPLLSSFACAIPGIMAARTLDNERDRLITIMVAPLMSCSARLPVYALFIAAFIPQQQVLGLVGLQGLTMFSMYLMGIAMAFAAAAILKRYVIKGSQSYFVMELPPYRRPRLRQVAGRMVMRSGVFARRAGKIIFGLSIVLWFLASFPKVHPEGMAPEAAAAIERDALLQQADSLMRPHTDAAGGLMVGAEHLNLELARSLEAQAAEVYGTVLDSLRQAAQSYQIRNSLIGRFGHLLEPVMQPLGFDWKISAGLVTAFAAREVIISTMGIIYSVGDGEDSVALRDALKADRYPDGRPVFTPLVAMSLLVFFVFALQCMSTLAIACRETGTWRWPAVMWLYMTAIAYVASLMVYQGGRMLGLG
ncbi:MAG: ferrous iron transport protein B [Bacteroidota bacterium]|nr:ferrous iron transport protein B [Bacteroidota bacterium]